jgi:glyoxylase-like metal-dependent hydrolase (beta-lactamase superfamily II)
VSHPRGFLLFDTGVHRQAITDPVGRLGERRAQLFGVRSGPGDHVVGQLDTLGLWPAEIGLVANSHFHFDRWGGNEFVPDATFLVQRRELAAARHPEAITTHGRYTPSARDFDRPLEYREVDGEHDVFRDGRSSSSRPTATRPGISRPVSGSASSATSSSPPTPATRRSTWIATCYPGIVWDSTEVTRSLAILRALRDRHGARLVCGHDPSQWRGLARAPAPLDAGG